MAASEALWSILSDDGAESVCPVTGVTLEDSLALAVESRGA